MKNTIRNAWEYQSSLVISLGLNEEDGHKSLGSDQVINRAVESLNFLTKQLFSSHLNNLHGLDEAVLHMQNSYKQGGPQTIAKSNS